MPTHRKQNTVTYRCKTRSRRTKVATISGSIIATITQGQAPSRRQIAAAIIECSKARAHQLIAGETLDLARPFSVFSRLEVEKIKVKHEKGSVTLEISEMLSQEDGRILPARTTEHELASSKKRWRLGDFRPARTHIPARRRTVWKHLSIRQNSSSNALLTATTPESW